MWYSCPSRATLLQQLWNRYGGFTTGQPVRWAAATEFSAGTTRSTLCTVTLWSTAAIPAAPTKTVHPNQTTHYAGLTWTLTTASTSSCNNNTSADQGTVFVKVTLKVDNPTSQPFINSVYSYIRLQSGSTTRSPMSGSDTPLPSSIESNTAGTMGIVTFSMPQGSNSFTLILLPQTNPAISQSTINFQI